MRISVVLLFFCATLFAQKKTESFNSVSLKASRELSIAVPASYEKNTTQKYPLLLLLDGQYLFDPFFGALQYGNYWDDMPEAIVVGINQTKRYVDCEIDEKTDLPTTKSAAFYNFVASELVPYLEGKYRIAPFKVIAGHGVTASFANFFLYKGEPLFNGYIAMSPELIPDMALKVPEKLAASKKHIFYYQCTSDSDIAEIQEPVKLFNENIKTISNNAVNYKFNNFKNTTHYSQVLFAVPNALNQIFEAYKPITPYEYQQNILSLKEDGYTEYLQKKYEFITNEMGLKVAVRLNDFKAIEAAIMQNKAYGELEKLATFAAEFFPQTLLSDYEMGIMYEKKNDPKRALKKYKDALMSKEIGDWTHALVQERYEDVKKLIPAK